MKYLQSIAFALIIGSIVAASTYSYQEASAMEDYSIIEKMIEVDKKLSDLNSMNAELNELSMSKISFKINQIKNAKKQPPLNIPDLTPLPPGMRAHSACNT